MPAFGIPAEKWTLATLLQWTLRSASPAPTPCGSHVLEPALLHSPVRLQPWTRRQCLISGWRQQPGIASTHPCLRTNVCRKEGRPQALTVNQLPSQRWQRTALVSSVSFSESRFLSLCPACFVAQIVVRGPGHWRMISCVPASAH